MSPKGTTNTLWLSVLTSWLNCMQRKTCRCHIDCWYDKNIPHKTRETPAEEILLGLKIFKSPKDREPGLTTGLPATRWQLGTFTDTYWSSEYDPNLSQSVGGVWLSWLHILRVIQRSQQSFTVKVVQPLLQLGSFIFSTNRHIKKHHVASVIMSY